MMGLIDLKNNVETGWYTVGASVAGTSHLEREQPCHDNHLIELLPHGEIIIAVADGAGSATKPEIGSKLAVKTAINCIVEKFTNNLPNSDDEWRDFLPIVFETAHSALEHEALTENLALNNYATTLIIVILTEKWTVCGLIGDCVAVILDDNNKLVSLCPPQKGEYANMTNFLTQSNALEQLDIQIQAYSVQGVAVLSDGLLNLALNIAQNEPYSGFFIPLFNFMAEVKNEQEAKQQLEAFLKSERINSRTDDDKTLVLARRISSKDSLT